KSVLKRRYGSLRMFLPVKFSQSRRIGLLAAGLAAFIIAATVEMQAASSQTAEPRTPTSKSGPTAKTNEATKSPRPEKTFDIEFKEFKLKNGLRVLLAEDHR